MSKKEAIKLRASVKAQWKELIDCIDSPRIGSRLTQHLEKTLHYTIAEDPLLARMENHQFQLWMFHAAKRLETLEDGQETAY